MDSWLHNFRDQGMPTARTHLRRRRDALLTAVSVAKAIRAEVEYRLGSLAAASRLRSLCQVPRKRPSQRWRLFGSFSFIFPPTIHSSPYDVFDDFSAPAPPYCILSNHTRYFALHSHVLPLCRRCPCRCSLHRQCVLFASPPHLRRILQDLLAVFFSAAFAASCTRTYTVKEGDWCDTISAANNVSTYVRVLFATF